MRTFLVAITIAVLTGWSVTPLFGQTPSIEGVWEGVSAATTGGPNASNNPKRQPNIHIYTKGYWMATAQDAAVPMPQRKAPAPLKTPGKPTDAEKIALHDFWAPLIANAGRYERNGNSVVQYNDVSKGAGGTKNTLEVKLEDGGKTLIETVKNADGSVLTRRFRRLE